MMLSRIERVGMETGEQQENNKRLERQKADIDVKDKEGK
jgi:hypothetical protein